MKFLFIVQGEGRGHMTQAISLADMLRNEEHEVVHILVGKSKQREIPSFFFEKIKTQVTLFESPNFIIGSKSKKINLWKTIIYNVFWIFRFIKSLQKINKVVKQTKPDVIINFYDILAGLYSITYRPKAKYVCIGHQFLLNHPAFVFPKGYKVDKILMRINTAVTSMRADLHLALSFRPMPDVPEKKIYVVPPLLRVEVTRLLVENEGYILGYILNASYGEEIEKWHQQHPQHTLHFFWDKKDAPEVLQVTPKLTFHKINDEKFLDMMSKCGAYCSTAGFESICEAMYLGKPIMMVPSYGHFEQACNAVDGTIAGAGIKNDVFDLTPFIDYIPKHKDITAGFRIWANSSRKRFLQLLTQQV
jgi:uncharacterized protein (TIGR00661 family)